VNDYATEHCRKLAFIQHGRIVAQGSPQHTKEAEMRGQVLEIDCAHPDAAVPALCALGLFDEVALYGSLIHVVAEDIEQHRPLISETLRERGAGVRSMDLIPPSLEDVFISSVQEARPDGFPKAPLELRIRPSDGTPDL
jgi:ABC-2 type transport system ATP-binding protein